MMSSTQWQSSTNFVKAMEVYVRGINLFLENGYKIGRPLVVLPQIPPVLQYLKLKNREIVVRPNVLAKILHQKTSDDLIEPDILKLLPYELVKPALVFKSNTDGGLVLITSQSDRLNRPIAVVIHENKIYGRRECHDVATIHGRSNWATTLEHWMSKELLLYLDTEKSPTLFESARIQSPMEQTTSSLSRIIPTELDVVKDKE